MVLMEQLEISPPNHLWPPPAAAPEGLRTGVTSLSGRGKGAFKEVAGIKPAIHWSEKSGQHPRSQTHKQNLQLDHTHTHTHR